EFVREARALRIENAVVADDEGVLERGTQRVARIPQRRHIAHEAEGARARKLAAEHVGFQVDRQGLAPDQRVIERDLRLDAETARVGSQLSERIAYRDLHRLEHLDVAARLWERGNTGRVNGCNERRGAAVPDR